MHLQWRAYGNLGPDCVADEVVPQSGQRTGIITYDKLLKLRVESTYAQLVRLAPKGRRIRPQGVACQDCHQVRYSDETDPMASGI